ncbi:polyketide synthase [Anopheles sinensis]|uniref:Polyketide synthase n=1 Tax=Anopheles sinensis TaxID=74873 RepID=A0A084VGD7_ANOSI|nr:polyketide synthase [Anopheles sinensis]
MQRTFNDNGHKGARKQGLDGINKICTLLRFCEPFLRSVVTACLSAKPISRPTRHGSPGRVENTLRKEKDNRAEYSGIHFCERRRSAGPLPRSGKARKIGKPFPRGLPRVTGGGRPEPYTRPASVAAGRELNARALATDCQTLDGWQKSLAAYSECLPRIRRPRGGFVGFGYESAVNKHAHQGVLTCGKRCRHVRPRLMLNPKSDKLEIE